MLQIARNVHKQIACKSKQHHLIASERIAFPFEIFIGWTISFSARFVGSYWEHWCGIGRACFKVFLTPCSQWLSPKNVALSVHSEVPPFCIEAVQVSSFPDTVDTMALSKNRKSRTSWFFHIGKQSSSLYFHDWYKPKILEGNRQSQYRATYWSTQVNHTEQSW